MENITKEKLDALMTSLEGSIGSYLAKADPGSQAPGEETPPGSSATPPPPAEASSDAPPADSSDAPPADDGSAPQDPAAQMAQGPMDPAAVEAEMDAMPIEDLQVLLQAAQNAIAKKGSAAPDAGAPPPAASAPPPAASAPPMAMSERSEFGERLQKFEMQLQGFAKATQEKDSEIARLKGEVAVATAKVADVNAKFGAAAEGLTNLLTKGTSLRKSAGGVSFLPRTAGDTAPTSEDIQLTRPDVIKQLNKASRDPKLTKADRDAIDGFVLRNKPVETVKKFLSANPQ